MRSARAQLTLTLVALILGMLVVVQLRAQSFGSSLDGRSTQDLTELIANLNRGNDDLREQAALLQQDFAGARSEIERGQSAASDVQRDINRLRGWAGLEAISGSGIRVLLTGDLPGDAVEDVINDIWSAGADGIAVQGIRLVPGVVVSGAPNALTVAGTPLTSPVEIVAVGDRDALAGTLRRAGGVLAQLSAIYPHVSATVNPLETLTLPATSRTLIPPDARPKL